jgi:hypothetical protein
VTSRMPLTGTSGSVGGLGGQPPRSTRPVSFPLVYDELRRLTARRMSPEAPGQTLQAMALVPGAYLRLVGDDPDLP